MAQRIFSSADFQDPPARGSRSGGGSVAARVVSALIGLIVTVPALLLVMAGGGRAYAQTLQQARTEPDVLAILLAVGGLVLLLIVALSGLLSATGPLIAGLIAAGGGVAFLVDPSLVLSVSQVVPGFGGSSVTSLVLWCQSGLLFPVGVVLLASALARAIAGRSRGARSGGARAIISVVVAVVAGPAGIALVSAGSARLLTTIARFGGAGTFNVEGLVLLVAGAIVLGGVALTSVWSSAGTAISGALLLVGGIAGFLPVVALWVFRATAPASSEFAGGVSTAVAVGFVAAMGIVLLGASASATRGRRSAR